jgi:hypothetical protein
LSLANASERLEPALVDPAPRDARIEDAANDGGAQTPAWYGCFEFGDPFLQ